MRVTLDIPQRLYDELSEIAEETHSTVEAIILERASELASPFARHPEQDKMQREVDYFDTHVEALWAKYPNQFVAVKDQQVIDHDRDESALFDRLEEQYPEEVVLVRKVTESYTGLFQGGF